VLDAAINVARRNAHADAVGMWISTGAMVAHETVAHIPGLPPFYTQFVPKSPPNT